MDRVTEMYFLHQALPGGNTIVGGGPAVRCRGVSHNALCQARLKILVSAMHKLHYTAYMHLRFYSAFRTCRLLGILLRVVPSSSLPPTRHSALVVEP